METEKAKATEQVTRYEEELAKNGVQCKAFAVFYIGKSEYTVEEI